MYTDEDYQRKGFSSRLEYMRELSVSYNFPLIQVFTLADLLGPEEDFDGLVSMLQEMEGMY